MTGNEYNDKANLNHEYMIVYQDMLRYLSSKDISLLVARDIRDDILAMALESQTRGLKVEEAFGDYQKIVMPSVRMRYRKHGWKSCCAGGGCCPPFWYCGRCLMLSESESMRANM
ncbi:hypothetical protein HMPREF9406_3696 [Clostridium sp. HGF2]|nr:hypothetical protein HMPREF9406_3696 [Clostridium sp. HGF2]